MAILSFTADPFAECDLTTGVAVAVATFMTVSLLLSARGP